MDSEKERLILDGNAFYEIDISCLREKKAKENEQKNRSDSGKTDENIKRERQLYTIVMV